MQKWEYRIEYQSGGRAHEETLKHYGEAGWELAGVINGSQPASDGSHGWPDVVQLIFKRPI
jgi:hypothetical protein